MSLGDIYILVPPSCWLPLAVHSPFPWGCLSSHGRFLVLTLSRPNVASPLAKEWSVVLTPMYLSLTTSLHLVCFSGNFLSDFLPTSLSSKQLPTPLSSDSTVLGSCPLFSVLLWDAQIQAFLTSCSDRCRDSLLGNEVCTNTSNMHQALLQSSLYLPFFTFLSTSLFSGSFCIFWSLNKLSCFVLLYIYSCCLLNQKFLLSTFI